MLLTDLCDVKEMVLFGDSPPETMPEARTT